MKLSAQEEKVFRFLHLNYVQVQNAEHVKLGAQYMTAETHHLARSITRAMISGQFSLPAPSLECCVDDGCGRTGCPMCATRKG